MSDLFGETGRWEDDQVRTREFDDSLEKSIARDLRLT